MDPEVVRRLRISIYAFLCGMCSMMAIYRAFEGWWVRVVVWTLLAVGCAWASWSASYPDDEVED